MSCTIMIHFEASPIPMFLASTHEDSFGISVKQIGGIDIWFNSPINIKTHEASYKFLNDVLNGMKRELNRAYKKWKEEQL